VDLTYKYTHLGSDAAAISKLAAGGDFLESLKKAQRPVLVVGPGVLNRWGCAVGTHVWWHLASAGTRVGDAVFGVSKVHHFVPHAGQALVAVPCPVLHAVLKFLHAPTLLTPLSFCIFFTRRRPDRAALLKAIHGLAEAAGVVKEGWNGYNVIHDNASRVAALDIGFLPSANARKHSGPVKLVYLLGADDFSEADVPKDAFVVYQGHHGDKGAARADVVLPGAAYTEKAGTYVNFEGRVQVRAGLLS
jgi:hypothetical protein